MVWAFAIHADFARQSNLEDVVDLIIEPSVFMVVTATYSHTTLDTQHQNEPLNTEQVGFVMGQIFGALNYLHDRGWVHGDLDPRSIHVMSREPLWVKLTDTALSKHFDLGKPDRYHATYASQKLMQIDKCPGDVWSAGVVALELLSGLPNRSGAAITKQTTWVADLERFAKGCDQKSGTQATAAVRRVLKHDPEARPTAADILGDPWLETTRGALFDVHKSHLNLITSEPSTTFSSRQGSASPIPVFCRNSEPPEPAFTDPPLPTFRSSSAAPSQISPAEALERMTELEKSKDGFYDVDNIDWDKAISFGSSSARSQSVDGGVQTPAMDWKTDGVGRVGGQREVGVPEDSGEETETGRREPVTKKSRKGKAAIPPPLSMKLRSRGKGKAREA